MRCPKLGKLFPGFSRSFYPLWLVDGKDAFDLTAQLRVAMMRNENLNRVVQ
jgi:hypothetical protein